MASGFCDQLQCCSQMCRNELVCRTDLFFDLLLAFLVVAWARTLTCKSEHNKISQCYTNTAANHAGRAGCLNPHRSCRIWRLNSCWILACAHSTEGLEMRLSACCFLRYALQPSGDGLGASASSCILACQATDREANCVMVSACLLDAHESRMGCIMQHPFPLFHGTARASWHKRVPHRRSSFS